MRTPTIDELKAAMQAKGHPFFEKGDDNVNTIAIRASAHDETGEAAGNRFIDLLCVAKKRGGAWEVHAYPCTTVPGDHYMRNPMNAEFGTAIIVPGFYPGSHKLGEHYRHPALQQCGNLSLYRDKDRDLLLDLDPATIQDTSEAGVNVHYGYNTDTVDNGSAGCVEHQAPHWSGSYQEFIGHYKSSIAAGFPNRFSLGLLLEGDVWPVAEQTASPVKKGSKTKDDPGVGRQEG